MDKEVKVIFLEQAEKEFQRINELVKTQAAGGRKNTLEMKLLKSINQKIEFIKANPFYGDNIPKILIPKEYAVKYNAKNLWRVELVSYWRMLYTIKGSQIEVICFVVDILDHKEYNKKFGYKRK
ncbi:MAG: hypothetical protein V1659_00410 [Candidatus Woesearchaeota archaeon]